MNNDDEKDIDKVVQNSLGKTKRTVVLIICLPKKILFKL